MVDLLHQAGIGVILDWVPAHFASDAYGLVRFDGTPLYEDPDPMKGQHPEWGTLVFDFARAEVRDAPLRGAAGMRATFGPLGVATRVDVHPVLGETVRVALSWWHKPSPPP